jgi:hypothetical protein
MQLRFVVPHVARVPRRTFEIFIHIARTVGQ